MPGISRKPIFKFQIFSVSVLIFVKVDFCNVLRLFFFHSLIHDSKIMLTKCHFNWIGSNFQ